MSLARSLLSLALSFLFVTLIFTTISSYTIGSLIEKGNLKSFVNSNIAPEFIEEQCIDLCKGRVDEEDCSKQCLYSSLNQTEDAIDQAIEELYTEDFFGLTLNDVSIFMSQFTLFLILTVVVGIILIIESENPLSDLGKSFISSSISLLLAGMAPNLIVGASIIGTPVLKNMFDYLSPALDLQTKIGIGLLILGIILLIIDWYRNREEE